MSNMQEHYESLASVSALMVEAAHANDWDQLTALEARMTAIRKEIASQVEGAGADPAELPRRVALINAVLANNREVQRHVEPWMQSVRKMFDSGQRERSVRAAYGAPPR